MISIYVVAILAGGVVSIVYISWVRHLIHLRSAARWIEPERGTYGEYRDATFPIDFMFGPEEPCGLLGMRWSWFLRVRDLDRLPASTFCTRGYSTLEEARVSALRMLASVDWPMAQLVADAMEDHIADKKKAGKWKALQHVLSHVWMLLQGRRSR